MGMVHIVSMDTPIYYGRKKSGKIGSRDPDFGDPDRLCENIIIRVNNYQDPCLYIGNGPRKNTDKIVHIVYNGRPLPM